MDQRANRFFFTLLRSVICGTMLTQEEREKYSHEFLTDLLKASTRHDIIHLLAFGLKRNALIQKEEKCIESSVFKAIYRYEQLNYTYGNLCNILESADIQFVPLKGSIIRQYYPEAWMRTSCDIDILIHEEDLDKASSILVNEYGYRYHGKSSYDISLFSPNQTHIELHYTLVEDDVVNETASVLKSVWDTVKLHHGYKNWYEMPDEMFYFYHIAHMAKHFEHGGCGIRPFIDLWILDNMQGVNTVQRNELLKAGNLLVFAEAVRKLSRIWFDNLEMDTISKKMEDYVLRGGVYGTKENRISVQQQKKGGRIRYAWSRIFLSYDEIKFHYPVLQKHRWLTPFMEIRRWCKLIFCGHAKRVAAELKFNQSIPANKANAMKEFLSSIGL